MLTLDHIEISGPYHKYESGIAEYCHYMAYQGDCDEQGGDVQDAGGWYARFGKHIITEDEHGFVNHHRFLTLNWACGMFDALEELSAAYATSDGTLRAQLEVEARQGYSLYVYRSALFAERCASFVPACPVHFADCLTFSEWLLQDRPGTFC